MRITVDLGKLYEDCYQEKKLSGQGKERQVAIERMVTVIKALRENGHTVDLHLGGLVGEMFQNKALISRSVELRSAIITALDAIAKAAE